jgi:hypothetical protein
MSIPSDPTDDDGSLSSVLISGTTESLSGLATTPGIDLVQGSATYRARCTAGVSNIQCVVNALAIARAMG